MIERGAWDWPIIYHSVAHRVFTLSIYCEENKNAVK